MITSIDGLEPVKRAYVQSICRLIGAVKPKSEIYIFGSYVKGCVSRYSDLDVLVLTTECLDQKQLRLFKYEIYDYIEEKLESVPDLDIKVYVKDKFYESAKELGFESTIMEYMIRYGGESIYL